LNFENLKKKGLIMDIERLEFNKQEIVFLKNAFEQSAIMPRIASLIVHGSSLHYPLTPGEKDSDIDLELILTSDCSTDLNNIREIVKSSTVRVECQLRYLDEIKSGLIFQSAYKLFMYFAYANGASLIGENIYEQLVRGISEIDVKRSILLSAQIAFKDIRKLFLGGSNEYNVNKGIMQVFRLICMFDGAVDYRKLGCVDYFEHQNEAFVSSILLKYEKLLDEQDVLTLKKFVRYYQSRRFLYEVFLVVNKIVNFFSKNFERGLL
jgi:hypothetical protein